ncbi:uncharacterized protein LOC135848310 [Planococcus citri]|uniref:uncharacterized protein LOC135848310 n=1 Tax=Planococcus citri TaxID=170843 RepID=UPI0031F8F15A
MRFPMSCKGQGTTTTTTCINQIKGKWYTHYVLGQYSPWKTFDCQTNEILYKRKGKTANVTSRFIISGADLPVEWNGTVLAANTSIGKFEFDYITDGWFFTQNTQFLQTSSKGAALAWTCLDFGIFHIESIAVMTKYQDPNDIRIPPSIIRKMHDLLLKAGISPTWFEPIVQENCDYQNFSSSQPVSVAKSLRHFVPTDFLKQLSK